jgi:hypothetical protein
MNSIRYNDAQGFPRHQHPAGGIVSKPSIEQLVSSALETGKLTYAHPDLVTAQFPEVGVRGRFVTLRYVDVTRVEDFVSGDLPALRQRVASMGYRAATMYELVYFVVHHWTHNRRVVAFGSHQGTGFLYKNGAELNLDVTTSLEVSNRWSLLAIRIEQG